SRRRTPRRSSPRWAARRPLGPRRSEEHTSELQSHLNLVCRLLLEKKATAEQVTLQEEDAGEPEHLAPTQCGARVYRCTITPEQHPEHLPALSPTGPFFF